MFRFHRIAAAFTLSLCAVAAPAQAIAPLPDFAPPVAAPMVDPMIDSGNDPVRMPLEQMPVEHITVEQSPPEQLPAEQLPVPGPVEALPAVSLEQLVQRHASTRADTDELECLAAAVYFESKGEPLAGQLAVARVIKNRSKSARFAKTYCGVVRQRGQFSFVRGSGFPAIARTGQHWRTAVAIATVADRDLWEAPAANALYFHAKRVAPSWHMVRLASVGNHVFYR